MKKLRLSIFAVISITALSMAIVKNSLSNEKNDLMLKNIEALSAGENSPYCVGDSFRIQGNSTGWTCYNNQGNSCCPLI